MIRNNGSHCIKYGPPTQPSFSHSITFSHFAAPVFRTRVFDCETFCSSIVIPMLVEYSHDIYEKDGIQPHF